MNTQPPSENDQLLTSWLAVIGMLVIQWSPVERHLDQCVHILFEREPTRKTKKKPTRLGQKLDYIKTNIPTQIIHSQEIEKLVKLTKATVQIRDVLVHGVLNSYDQDQIEVGKVNGTVGQHVIETFIIDRNRLDRSANALSHLQEQWHALAASLLKQKRDA